MQIDIKYNNQVISTIEEEESQILATKDTFLTDNIIVDVVEEGGIDTSDATATAKQIAKNKIAYTATGKTVGAADINTAESITPDGIALQIPAGIYRETTTGTFPTPTVTTVHTTSISENVMSLSSNLTLAQSAYLNSTGITGTTNTVSINDLASGSQTVIDNGTYNIAAKKELVVAVPNYNGEIVPAIKLDQFSLPYCSGGHPFYIIDSYEIAIYPYSVAQKFVSGTIYYASTTMWNFVGELMTISGGTISTTEPGTYTCIISLSDGYKFKDTQLTTREVQWIVET